MPHDTDQPGSGTPAPDEPGATPAAEPSPSAPEFEDPIGDMSDGEAHFSLSDQVLSESGDEAEPEEEAEAAEHGQPRKLERLQKVLSQAGIASRRHAEEMIVAGRVMVNGQVVTTLGTKADPVRDHIRVDGKLLSGAEHHRYFVLNKPKGYVTTVSDPEGRPTVTQFFAKMRERLYPVGRLDFQSEGLLLMTNDGELANRLTRAASGVEKTYIVKIAGQPTEEELERLRGGVSIERGASGSHRVRTAPARIRQIRQGDNPWYEVVLIEGRNRELRKMFSTIGHFVEKIRRVGYGPLMLDVEPGKFRELAAEEVEALRLTAEGKLKPRRPKSTNMLPKEAGRRAEELTARPPQRGGRSPRPKTGPRGKTEWKPREQRFSGGREQREPLRGQRPTPQAGPSRQREEPRFGEPPRRTFGRYGQRPAFKSQEERQSRFGKTQDRSAGKGPGRGFGQRPERQWQERPEQTGRKGPERKGPAREGSEKDWKRPSGQRPARPGSAAPAFGEKPAPAARSNARTGGRPFGSRGKPNPAKHGKPRPDRPPNRRKRP